MVGVGQNVGESMTTVQNLMILFLGPWFLALPVLAGKSFDGLTCNSDIAHELMGRKMEENEPVAKIEQRYRHQTSSPRCRRARVSP